MLLLSDPLIAAATVRDCGEGLVDLRAGGRLLVDSRKADRAGAWARLRPGVVQRLVAAQATLPCGVRLLVIEGYRPPGLQRFYFDRHRDSVRQAHPDWPAELVDAEASKHVSPPAVAPHPCGAAVDLTLWRAGAEMDLGTPVNATPDQSAGACFTAAPNLSATARHWRDVLSAALSAVGLVNYPPEWWHWSYGDRFWAVTTGAPAALYDVVHHQASATSPDAGPA